MAQHDYVIDNQSFPATRTDINNALLAISSTNSGTSAPSTTYANQLWYDTTNNKLYIRNEDNDAWIPLFLLDQSNDKAGTLATEIDIEDASGTNAAGTALTVKGGAGTGTGAGGAIIFQTADGGSSGSSVNAHATRVTITDDGKVGIGVTSPEALTHIAGATADADGALGSQSPQLIIEGGNTNNPFEIGMDNSGATAIGFLQSRNKSAGAQFISLNPKGGAVLVGKTASSNSTGGVEIQTVTSTSSSFWVVKNTTGSACIYTNRTSDSGDGSMIFFASDETVEGSISVSGTTVSYNGGHLSRWSQLTDGTKDTSIVKGTVMTNLNQMAVWSHDAVEAQDAVLDDDGNVVTEAVEAKDAYTEDNEQLNCMAVSSVEGDPNVAGVFVNWDNDDDNFNDMNVAMTGDMVIRIAQGTTVARGDLLISAGDGTAKPQDEDIVRSKTIAKVISTHVSHTYDDGTYLVPCVLMAC